MPEQHLTPQQLEGLAKRFPHFDAERTAPLFHQDQDGRALYKDREYPAALMRNGVRWLYDRKHRPKQKSLAPPGPRPLLTDDPKLEGEWFIIVEGEADAVALLSVGITGVACVGGTNTAQDLAPSFKGKRLYLLFDGDDAGNRAAKTWALALQEAGARAVLIASLPEGEDPETFLAKQDTPDAASAELRTLLGRATEPTASALRESLREKDQEDGFDYREVWSETFDVDARLPLLAVTVWEPGWPTTQLAVYGPPNAGHRIEDAAPYPGQATEEAGASDEPVWRLLPEGLRLPRLKMVVEPARVEDLGLLEDGTIVLPPAPPLPGDTQEGDTPERADSPALLVTDMTDYFNRWCELPKDAAAVQTAFVLAVTILWDAGFQKAPYLRCCGDSGTGKSQNQTLVSNLCAPLLRGALTADNVHRISHGFPGFTLCWDEFNLERFKADAANSIMNTMNAGQDKGERVWRYSDKEAPSSWAKRVFGPRIFGGYLENEDTGFRRRTINIDMDEVDQDSVPDSKRFSQLPRAAIEEARELRRRLLVWRAAQLERGEADPQEDESHRALLEHGVRGMLPAWWPLLWALPEESRDERAAVLRQAAAQEAVYRRPRQTDSLEANTLELLANACEHACGWWKGAPAVQTKRLAAELDQERGFRSIDTQRVGQVLRGLGIDTHRTRALGGRGQAVVLNEAGRKAVARAMRRYGISWDPERVSVQSAGPRLGGEGELEASKLRLVSGGEG